jgi:hypothetical protein
MGRRGKRRRGKEIRGRGGDRERGWLRERTRNG